MLIKMKVFCICTIPLLRFFILKKVEVSSTFIPFPEPIRVTSELKTCNQRRSYSTGSKKYTPLKVYSNADTDKLNILKDNKGKSGIYMWTNLENNKRYIGSSVDLKRRLLEYFNINRLLRSPSMIINLALLKRGYSKFSLTILEYCEVDKLLEREKHYFNLLNPEYNILKEPGSPGREGG
jgi:hypothetical protein